MSLFGLNEDFFLPSCSLDELLIKNRPSTYLFRMKGKRWAPWIMDRDILVVDRSLTPKLLDMVVAEIEGEFKVCEINKNMEMSIFGVVTSIIREARGQNFWSR